jgi:hypothetical protein
MIASHADLLRAYDAGRFHSQRFIKTGVGQAGDAKWQDWAFQAGQPAYDARIGVSNTFTPVVAVKNDALYFPDIPAGMERKLHKLFLYTKASNASQATVDFVLYDLVGYYPLIDGDSTDPQDMNNTLTLPRYTDGKGLQLVMVNHVAPAVQGGLMTLDYTDSQGLDHSIVRGVAWNGQNFVASGVSSAVGGGGQGPLVVSLEIDGIQRVNRVTYSTPPGGLHCLYLIKPLAQFQHYHDALLQADTSGVKSAIEVDFALKDGWRMPVIKDGAHLSFFYRCNGGGRNNTFFGAADFIWG